MEKVYVFGHRNPDTDSVTAAITLAYLKRKQGLNAIPVILSSISKETSYALNYFKVKEPLLEESQRTVICVAVLVKISKDFPSQSQSAFSSPK